MPSLEIQILTMKNSRPQYSADVDLRMLIDGQCVELCQLGPMFAILKYPTAIPPATEATIEVIVDNRKTSTRVVFLYQGATQDSTRVDFF